MNRSDFIASLGLSVCLVIYATQVWGGIFPFLPDDFQTENVTLLFYFVQNVAFVTALIASVVGSYYFPEATKRMLVIPIMSMVAAGSLCVIAAMYVDHATLIFVVAGAALLGVGMAGSLMLWQRYFSSLPPDACNRQLIFGSVLAALIYFALYLIPIALTAFLIPIVLLPLGALCLTISIREMDFAQPMFEDIPQEHPEVYQTLVRDLWRSIVAVSALGLASGLARGVAIAHASAVGEVVNIASVAGMLIVALVLLGLSLFRSVRFGLIRSFRLLFPVIITGFLLFPFFGPYGLSLFAGIAYMAFSAIVLIMMMQSAQISRDRGTNPVFVYGLLAAFVYAAQAIGFLIGWYTDAIALAGVEPVILLSLVSSYVVGMALFIISRPPRSQRHTMVSQVELSVGTARQKPTGAMPLPIPTDEGRTVRDRLSKQCLVAQGVFGLSSREAEVAELIARGHSVAQISEELFISENTVRTHSKHIYTKMDIHSKQELSTLLETMDLTSLGETAS